MNEFIFLIVKIISFYRNIFFSSNLRIFTPNELQNLFDLQFQLTIDFDHLSDKSFDTWKALFFRKVFKTSKIFILKDLSEHISNTIFMGIFSYDLGHIINYLIIGSNDIKRFKGSNLYLFEGVIWFVHENMLLTELPIPHKINLINFTISTH